MRKILKYLIPIIGSVSITTPFLVSCNKESTWLELNKTELNLNKRESEKLIAIIHPEGTSGIIKWSS